MRFSDPQPNVLANAFGLGPAQERSTIQPAFSPGDLDKVAQARGYRDYNHMIYVAQHGLPRPKQDNYVNPTQADQGSGVWNFLQHLFADPKQALSQAFAWHPANTIGIASDALAQANAQNK